MSGPNLPGTGSRVQVVVDGVLHPCRVERADAGRLTLTAPAAIAAADAPAAGVTLGLRWTDQRGRHDAPVHLATVRPEPHGTWDVEVVGAVAVAQERAYVRGGGGEPLRLRRTDPPGQPVEAEVVDVGERGVRGRFRFVDVAPGDPVSVEFALDDGPVDVRGRVLRVIEQPALRSVDVVVVFEPSEAQATRIRRHVLAAQLRARTGRAG
ncbi:hypothetical protein GCM10010123_32040 [Pilimelia anulata]|uniref:PilZ domain-containing protein n=1 Tax=Pilimelia anulata TaxID=53371 RepID=A0A8J3FA63_9ACTN|nr:PilZ domain-containing protein [Pilimelia anulata]GGJ99672.1 hypothetical protein GCM10010123_32040 [Pilimelia anulata]